MAAMRQEDWEPLSLEEQGRRFRLLRMIADKTQEEAAVGIGFASESSSGHISKIENGKEAMTRTRFEKAITWFASLPELASAKGAIARYLDGWTDDLRECIAPPLVAVNEGTTPPSSSLISWFTQPVVDLGERRAERELQASTSRKRRTA